MYGGKEWSSSFFLIFSIRKATKSYSEWKRIWMAGVSQGSILGPLFFYFNINDLPDNLESNVKLFVDDA